MGEITILGSQNNPWLETSEDNLRLFRTDLQTTETRIGTDCRLKHKLPKGNINTSLKLT